MKVTVRYRCNKCQTLQDGSYPAQCPRPLCAKGCGERVVIVKFITEKTVSPRRHLASSRYAPSSSLEST